jgi:hypothetical protein
MLAAATARHIWFTVKCHARPEQGMPWAANLKKTPSAGCVGILVRRAASLACPTLT